MSLVNVNRCHISDGQIIERLLQWETITVVTATESGISTILLIRNPFSASCLAPDTPGVRQRIARSTIKDVPMGTAAAAKRRTASEDTIAHA
jgi:hypothetical protein